MNEMTTELLLTLLTWLLTNVITKLSEKTKLSQTRTAIIVSIVLWALIYVWQIFTTKHPVQWQECMAFIGWTYWMSQLVYNMLSKYNKKQ